LGVSIPTLLQGALFFLSGLTALVYQVLWMKECGLLFGNTAHAAALTLAVFFLGLALGSDFWGRRVAGIARPLSAYAALELGIALTALSYFALVDSYHWLYLRLAHWLDGVPGALTMVKAALAAALFLPPAILMGGTFPVMGRQLIRKPDRLGRIGSGLYAINTLGGAVGAFVVAFYFPLALGFRDSYLLAIGLSLTVAALAYLMSRILTTPPTMAGAEQVAVLRANPGRGVQSWRGLLVLAFVSGFATLSLEVLWTRMFAQVLHNSVYSFAIILVTFLIAIAVGAGLAHLLARRALEGANVLFVLATLAGVTVGLTPTVFHWITGGLAYVAPRAGWVTYVASVFGIAALVMLIPGILIGAIYPYLLRMAERQFRFPGDVIGRVTAFNTVGAVAGSLIAGFVFLKWLGLWVSVRTVAVLYLLLAAYIASQRGSPSGRRGRWMRAAPIAAMIAFITFLDPGRLPIVRLDRAGGESLYRVWEGSHGTVAVVGRQNGRFIKVDNYYSLGGTSSRTYEETQADVVVVLHPRPKSVFFLGMGTGITAGAALRHAVERVTVVELIPEVVTAARDYFGREVNGLFTDPRAEVVVEDGRHFLKTTAARYDVIISDLFIPWQSGAGALYTREHFEVVRARLSPDGVFAQWLPLYQLSQRELFTIVRTMLEVFPRLSVWRGDFLPERPIVALVGQGEGEALDFNAVVENFRRRRGGGEEITRHTTLGLVGLFYAGNLRANAKMFQEYPLNSDDRPVVEYLAPITQRERRDGEGGWFTSLRLAEWYEELFRGMPPERDPLLGQLSEEEVRFVRAGLSLFKSRAYRSLGRTEEARAEAESFIEHVPAEVYETFERQVRGDGERK
jgi:spermidine synthase